MASGLGAWLKTGSKASSSHPEALGSGLFELSAYGHKREQQGRLVVALTSQPVVPGLDSHVWSGTVMAIEDEYYLWWFEETYGVVGLLPDVIFHFCSGPQRRCKATVLFSRVIHADVYRPLPDEAYKKLGWLRRPDLERIRGLGEKSAVTPPAVLPAGPAPSGVVQLGEEGLVGLAGALRGDHHPPGEVAATLGLPATETVQGDEQQARGDGEQTVGDKRRKDEADTKGDSKKAKVKPDDLDGVLADRKAREPAETLGLHRKATPQSSPQEVPEAFGQQLQ